MNIKTLSVIALTAVSTTAFAGEQPEFKAVDMDSDGYVSMEEAKSVPGLAEIFSIADVDNDGKLDEAEYSEVTQS
ncbi:MAG: EF-hand domain-containing protein [Amphritea sp.]